MEGVPTSLAAIVEGKRVVPSVPPGRTVVLAGEEGLADDQQRGQISAVALFIEYCAADGAVSMRRIVCRSFDPARDQINAWCFERSAMRSFKVDRIRSAACPETGEVFDMGTVAAMLRQKMAPLRDSRLTNILRILTFMIRCDGTQAVEMAALEDAVTSYAIRFDGDDALIEQAMRQARAMAPDDRDFLDALRSLASDENGPALARFVRTQAQRIIDADGRHSPEEVKFGIELDHALARIAGG